MQRLVIVFLLALVALSGGVIYGLWHDRLDLARVNSQKVQDFYAHLASSQVSFTDAGQMVFPDEQKFLTRKEEYKLNKESFIEANLRTMKLGLYENGALAKEMDILTKGKEGSWWETPTGNYTVLAKEEAHFSTIGNVWMPYSIQFYGNYFIHGWPHHEDGTPVPKTYSGGCIRLSDEDAKVVFEFARKKMPVLVLEDEQDVAYGSLARNTDSVALPVVSAKAFLVSNLVTGETLAGKNPENVLPIASLTKLMTAIVAHELVYLGRQIEVTPATLASASQVFHIAVGERYTGFDLLYPLLMQSSNDAAKTLAAFLGGKYFVTNMNAKALSLSMNQSHFADSSGISPENTSTANDLLKLLQYIYYKRRFIFDISKGKAFENVGLIKIGDTISVADLKNFNEFSADPDLIGMKNGETTAARQTMATVWNIHAQGGDVPVSVLVLGSEDHARDTVALLKWLRNNFEARD